jgi:hypothetical protein
VQTDRGRSGAGSSSAVAYGGSRFYVGYEGRLFMRAVRAYCWWPRPCVFPTPLYSKKAEQWTDCRVAGPLNCVVVLAHGKRVTGKTG